MNDFKKKETRMEHTHRDLSRENLISKALDYHANGNIHQAINKLLVGTHKADARALHASFAVCESLRFALARSAVSPTASCSATSEPSLAGNDDLCDTAARCWQRASLR